MAQLEFTGKAMTWTWNSVEFDGVLSVMIDEQSEPLPEALDVTVSGDTTYTYLTDPLGGKGDDKVTVTVKVLTSTASYADSKDHKHAFNSAKTGVLDFAAGTSNAQTWTNTTLELTSRTTEIPWDAYATCTFVFESNALGTWDSPA